MYNKITLVGRAGRDAEIRYTQGQTKLASFSLATSEYWKDKDGVKQERTEWHNIKCFGKSADIAEKIVRKGGLYLIEGSIHYSKWEGRDGVEKNWTEVKVQRIISLSKAPGKSQSAPPDEAPPTYDDDDIPF